LQNSNNNSRSKQKVDLFFSNPVLITTHSACGDLGSVSLFVSQGSSSLLLGERHVQPATGYLVIMFFQSLM